MDCTHLKGYSANPCFMLCDRCYSTASSGLWQGQRGVADKQREEHVCGNFEPDYGPDYAREILLPLVNRGDTLARVVREYYGDVPNPYSLWASGPLLKLHDSPDGILPNHIGCALSDWMPICGHPFAEKPILWLALQSTRFAAMYDEGDFLLVRTPQTMPAGPLFCELSLFLLKTTPEIEEKCREHLLSVVSGDHEYL